MSARPTLGYARLSLPCNWFNPVVRRWTAPAERPASRPDIEGWTVLPLPGAVSHAAGPLAHADWERLSEGLLSAIERAQPDALLLELHGAARTTEAPRPEAALLLQLRERLGDRPIGLILDRRGNAGPDLTDPVDIAMCGPTARLQTVRELARRLAGGRRRVAALARTPYCLPAAGFDRHAALWNELQTGAALTSLFCGFSYADTAEGVVAALAWGDDLEHARGLAREAGMQLIDARTRPAWRAPGPGTSGDDAPPGGGADSDPGTR